jgi:hypothetical protein
MNDLLPEKIAQIIPMYEQAMLELFDLHKEELTKLSKSDDWVDGISYDIIPSTYQTYSGVSFRTRSDYKDSETGVPNLSLKNSPGDWKYYDILEYRTSKSEKFKQVSEYIFQLFEDIYNRSEDYDAKQGDINHLIYLAVAEAVLQPSLALKLRELGFRASVVTDYPDTYTFDYMVTDVDETFRFNFCDLVVANRMTKAVIKKLKI